MVEGTREGFTGRAGIIGLHPVDDPLDEGESPGASMDDGPRAALPATIGRRAKLQWPKEKGISLRHCELARQSNAFCGPSSCLESHEGPEVCVAYGVVGGSIGYPGYVASRQSPISRDSCVTSCDSLHDAGSRRAGPGAASHAAPGRRTTVEARRCSG